MTNYNSQLENLFARWIERSEQNDEPREEGYGRVLFTKDGLMEKNDSQIDISKAWLQSKRRVMFLLKDQPTKWGNDSRLWLKDIENEETGKRQSNENNRQLRSRFIHNIANIFWGLWNSTSGNPCTVEQLNRSQEQVKQCFNTNPFAFVECKKQGGGPQLSDKTLRHYLNSYGDLLKEEIELLDPNIIVCTNQHIYNFVQNMYGNEFERIEGHNSIRVDLKHKKVILCSYHPSARRDKDTIYWGAVKHFNAYLQSDYPQFL